jgi:hypothetical protein
MVSDLSDTSMLTYWFDPDSVNLGNWTATNLRSIAGAARRRFHLSTFTPFPSEPRFG